jgi:hypothetical protein
MFKNKTKPELPFEGEKILLTAYYQQSNRKTLEEPLMYYASRMSLSLSLTEDWRLEDLNVLVKSKSIAPIEH